MRSALNETVLAFAKVLLEIVEVVQTCVSDRFLDCCDPFVFIWLRREIIYSPFVREYQHERVEHCAVHIILLELFLEIHSGKTLHLFVLQVALVLVAVKLLAQEHEPVLLQGTSSFLLLQDFAFLMHRVFTLAAITTCLVRRARQSTNAVYYAVLLWDTAIIENVAHSVCLAWRAGHALALSPIVHGCVSIDEHSLLLRLLITLQVG